MALTKEQLEQNVLKYGFKKKESSTATTTATDRIKKLQQSYQQQQSKKSRQELNKPQAPEKKPSFLKGEITGQNQKPAGFFSSLLQNTLGSKGVLGVAQMPGKVLSQPALLKESTALSNSQSGLADITLKAIKKKQTLTDPEKIVKLDRVIQSNLKTLKENNQTVSGLESQTLKPQETAATALRAGATVMPGGPNVATRVANASISGGLFGAGESLEEGKDTLGVAKGTAIGAATGAATAGFLEAVGSGLKYIFSKGPTGTYIQRRTGQTYNKELQPKVSDIAKDIEKGFATMGEQIADVTDDIGKPVYIGNYRALLNKSNEQLKLNNGKLSTLLNEYDDVITRDQVAGDVIEQMQDIYGKLSNSQISKIKAEVARMPKSMTLTGVRDAKMAYDKLIPKEFWTKLDDPAVSFPSYVKYLLRDNARKVINDTTGNPLVQKFNNEMSTAMDVRKLAANQLAKRGLVKISEVGGAGTTRNPLSYFISMMIDDILTPAALTTRATQTVRRTGQRTGTGLLNQLLRKTDVFSLTDLANEKYNQ
jgi:hypothetical protein